MGININEPKKTKLEGTFSTSNQSLSIDFGINDLDFDGADNIL